MKYCTDDGKKVFDTEEEYFAYENKLAEESVKKEEQERVGNALLDELNEHVSKINEIKNNYEKLSGKKLFYFTYNGALEIKEITDKGNPTYRLINSLASTALNW